jgi:hypothetical protein
MSFSRGNNRRDGRDKQSGIKSVEIKSERYEESVGGLPFLSNNSTNKNSYGFDSPPNDLPVEKQEAILFGGPYGEEW